MHGEVRVHGEACVHAHVCTRAVPHTYLCTRILLKRRFWFRGASGARASASLTGSRGAGAAGPGTTLNMSKKVSESRSLSVLFFLFPPETLLSIMKSAFRVKTKHLLICTTPRSFPTGAHTHAESKSTLTPAGSGLDPVLGTGLASRPCPVRNSRAAAPGQGSAGLLSATCSRQSSGLDRKPRPLSEAASQSYQPPSSPVPHGRA